MVAACRQLRLRLLGVEYQTGIAHLSGAQASPAVGALYHLPRRSPPFTTPGYFLFYCVRQNCCLSLAAHQGLSKVMPNKRQASARWNALDESHDIQLHAGGW